MDPKAITKDELYGVLDASTLEWTDGMFTHCVRKIIDNQRGELNKRQWIVFDGDVDPEWVENLNSVLDDNKLLTLPNGERLALPKNIRIIFEVQDLKNATLATVSRCGMVWFSEDVLTLDMHFKTFLENLKNVPLPGTENTRAAENTVSPSMAAQKHAASVLSQEMSVDGLVGRCLDYVRTQEHIMVFTAMRALNSLFAMVRKSVHSVIVYNTQHSEFPLSPDQAEQYVLKRLLYAVVWSFAGDAKYNVRRDLSKFIRRSTTIPLPVDDDSDIIDFFVTLPESQWVAWKSKVPPMELDVHRIAGTDVVVPTIDTVRHEDLLYAWLSEHLPMVLCGPPGSGKTMTLFSALRALPDFEVAGLNFSSATTPALILKTFEQWCEYRRTPNGLVLAPTQMNKWLIVFCDEINLPATDKYNTVRVITFMRQLVEQGGFWRSQDHSWVKLDRIQFVGACNPPTDPGRVPLDLRFLRHVPVIYVDYPGPESLKMIYGTFNRALMRTQPNLRQYAEPLTDAMVDFFTRTAQHFTQDMQPHYVYSPREMTRWVKGISEAISPLENLDANGLVRIWAHEALRLFSDRLVYAAERSWTDENVAEVARQHFPSVNINAALQQPILFSNWLTKEYVSVDREQLREFTKARLKVFYEEELDVPLVLFDEVLDHVLRIDRIFRQNQGHLLLIGASGAGKTTLSRFVAWMNGLSVYQVKAHKAYTAADFDEDLRNVLRRSGTKGEKIVFIMDESNVMDTAFLERMNTLLANGEVPGLFEGDEYAALMTACKEGSQREGLVLDGNDELYKWFSKQVMNNLHVVFTMNPSEAGLHDRAATSPALFNRCVLDWFGDWSENALFQVGSEFTSKLDLDVTVYKPPQQFPVAFDRLPLPPSHRQAVINAGVFVHKTVQQAARRMLKREGRSTHVTPRHFLEFVNQFVHISNEKRAKLEDQQLHLNVGLKKLRETVEQVELLQHSLAEKSAQLEAKNEAANRKLKQMVQDQQAAEEKRASSLKIEKELQEKQVAAEEKRNLVLGDLAKVEPALAEAKQAVEGVRKRDLQELKTLANPPAVVKLALESVLCLLGEPSNVWNNIRSVIVQDDFLKKVLDFNPEAVSAKVREQMEQYLNNPDYTFDRADRASKAAGPLVKWAIASTSYASMLLSIEPLRNELKRLESDATVMKEQVAQTQALIAELETSIAKYKEEYAVLVSEAQAIKNDLSSVSAKVERSTKLLRSLDSERDRWGHGSKEFDAQMATMVGDCLLASAFVSYAGYFDQSYRTSLFNKWCAHLKQANINFKHDLSIVEFLSTPDERLSWKQNQLPDDSLCTENAIMIKRRIRYPLIIDPSGQATEFVRRQLADQKLTPTSFLDSAFRKNLESALRFGTPLLVQDAESYDPLLNPVLNREVRRAGGRVLISVGDADIDLSPTFNIILTTRNPAVPFPPDICSRVTLINFTVTRSSLQTQCLNQVLRAERPDVDKKRSDLLKLQGEFRLRLRQLESELLQSLNEARGSILDDDAIITKLENLKREAGEITQKVSEADSVMAEIETTSRQYSPLAHKCSAIYFCLEQMHTVHFLYRYSLQFFLDIFKTVLTANPKLEGVRDYSERLSIITKYLFQVTFERCSPGLLNHHRVAFALTLVRFYLEGTPEELPAEALGFFMRGSSALSVGKSDFAFLVPKVLTEEQSAAAHALAHEVPAFADLAADVRGMPDFAAWMASVQPEDDVPPLGGAAAQGLSKSARGLAELLVVQAFRPDRLMARSQKFVDTVLPDMLRASREAAGGLGHAVEKEVDAKTPLLLCGESGYDPSGHVRDLYLASNHQCTEIALGAEEAFEEADKAITSAAKSGRWVLLKNAHLAINWLVKLEKRMLSLTPHPQFRLFLTALIHPKLPVSLLCQSRVFVYEPAVGIKASLLSTMHRFPDSMFAVEPAERGRVYFLLAWLHAVTQERLRYAPLGWSKKYEFGESDLRTASDTLSSWMTAVAQGRAHIAPEKIPWPALRTLLAQTIYGGRIDNDIDQRLLSSFVSSVFTEKSFSSDFALVPADPASGTAAVLAPEGSRREQFMEWVAGLPNSQPPTWLGLPANAEMVLLTTLAKNLAADMLKLLTIDDDADDARDVVGDAVAGAAPLWMRTLQQQCTQWLSALPAQLQPLRRTAENIKDPMFRFFEREVNIGMRLLRQVRADLGDVGGACAGTVKQTNAIRALMTDLVKGVVPRSWRAYKVPDGITANQWIADFGQRVDQLLHLSRTAAEGQDLRSARVWLGGLFNPEAFITATRQAVAQAHSWSLEKLTLELDVRRDASDVPAPDKRTFLITGLRIDGATCAGDVLSLISLPFSTQPLTVLRWSLGDDGPRGETVQLPVYLNATRANLVFMVSLRPSAGLTQDVFYKRGVALLCSHLSGLVR